LVVTNVAPEIRARGLPREQYLGVDAVNVLFLQPLLGRARARRGGVVLAVRLPDVAPLATVQIKGDLAQGLALDGPGVAAVRQPYQARRLIAVLFRHPVHPALGVDFQVGVAGDVAIVTSHGVCPFSGTAALTLLIIVITLEVRGGHPPVRGSILY